jgi:transcriptional regulator of acetoin/glycerol metabolism
LRNVIESMFLLAAGPSLGLRDLPAEMASPPVIHRGQVGEPAPATKGKLEDSGLAFIRETIEAHRGNLTLVAKQLGIAKSTLYIKLKKYGLDQVVSSVRGPGH